MKSAGANYMLWNVIWTTKNGFENLLKSFSLEAIILLIVGSTQKPLYFYKVVLLWSSVCLLKSLFSSGKEATSHKSTGNQNVFLSPKKWTAPFFFSWLWLHQSLLELSEKHGKCHLVAWSRDPLIWVRHCLSHTGRVSAPESTDCKDYNFGSQIHPGHLYYCLRCVVLPAGGSK